MMALPRRRNNWKIHITVTLLFLLVGFTAAKKTEEESSNKPAEEEEEKKANVRASDDELSEGPDDDNRDTRHIHPSYRRYGDIPLTVVAGRPTVATTHASSTLAGAIISPGAFAGTPSFQASRIPVSTRAVVPYSPTRSQAPAVPFLIPGVGLRNQVTPVPFHLLPLQQPTHLFGVTPDVPGVSVCPSGLECVPLVRCAPCYHEVEN
ncbi:hypothetical protein OTU49_015975, partial [Cherax quadricarinatus]